MLLTILQRSPTVASVGDLVSDPLLSSAPKLLGEPTLGRAGSGNLLQLLPLEKVEVLALVADVVVEIELEVFRSQLFDCWMN